jgi:5,5'-dehydrodivanillate O-demethylase
MTDAQSRFDFIYTSPGTPGGRYLRQFWQPVYRGQDLAPGQALPVRIMGEDFTLYRGEGGEAHAVAFRCAHRGTQLSTGWVEEDCLRCLYHGWRYDATGQCVEQPGEDPAFAQKVRIRGYPTEEYLGLVFVYFGAGDVPPLRRFPDWERPGVLETDPPEPWPCNFFNRLDNDPAHVPWTHRESTRRTGQDQRHLGSSRQQVHAAQQYVETEYGAIGATGEGNRYVMPNVNALRVPVKTTGFESYWEYRLIFHVPVDDENSTAFDVNLVPGLAGEEAERFRQRRRALQEGDNYPEDFPYEFAQAILAGKKTVRDVPADLSLYKQFWIEDYVTQVGQGRIADRSAERLGRNDAKPIFRRMLWQREVAALAASRPTKQWTSPILYPEAGLLVGA